MVVDEVSYSLSQFVAHSIDKAIHEVLSWDVAANSFEGHLVHPHPLMRLFQQMVERPVLSQYLARPGKSYIGMLLAWQIALTEI